MAPRSTSLVIATYNRGPRIAATLKSTLRQSRPFGEVVVVDDCSTDGTGDWVQANYPAVRVVRTPRNLYTSGARNFGAAAAAGDTLVFLDHDDVLHPHAAETLVGLLDDFPEARAAFADHTYVNLVTGVRYPDHHTAQPAFHRLRWVPVARAATAGRLYAGRGLYRALLRGNLLQQPWAIDRETFLRLGGFAADVRFCEDWDLYLRVTRAVPVALSDHVVSDHVIEGENLHLTPDQAEMHVRVLRRRLTAERFHDPAACWLLHRRLAGYHKAAGDRAAPDDLGRAWRCYLRSFAHWPFDHVVAARLLLWPVKLCRRPRPSQGVAHEQRA